MLLLLTPYTLTTYALTTYALLSDYTHIYEKTKAGFSHYPSPLPDYFDLSANYLR